MALTAEQNIYYLYRHVRLDTDDVFYVGISHYKKGKFYSSDKNRYNRAHRKHRSRSDFWCKLVNSIDENYLVEIVYECDSEEVIKEKEKEFISLYGRRDLNEGTLVNFTDGGDGTFGLTISDETKELLREINTGNVHSEETKLKISKAHKKNPYWKGRNHTDETKKKISENSASKGKCYAESYSAKEVVQFCGVHGDYMKSYASMREAVEETDIPYSQISSCANNSRNITGGYIFYLKENLDENKIYLKNHTERNKLPIGQFTKDGDYVTKWRTARDIERELGISRSSIYNVCNKNRPNKSAGGFVWKYIDEEKWD